MNKIHNQACPFIIMACFILSSCLSAINKKNVLECYLGSIYDNYPEDSTLYSSIDYERNISLMIGLVNSGSEKAYIPIKSMSDSIHNSQFIVTHSQMKVNAMCSKPTYLDDGYLYPGDTALITLSLRERELIKAGVNPKGSLNSIIENLDIRYVYNGDSVSYPKTTTPQIYVDMKSKRKTYYRSIHDYKELLEFED